MADCPNEECHKRLEELCQYVYGKTGPGSGLMGKIQALRECSAKKMPKVWVWYFGAAFAIPIIMGSYNLFSKAEMGDLKYETKAHAVETYDQLKKVCQENSLRGRLNEDRYIQIKEDLTEIKGMVRVLFKKIDDNKEP